MLSLCICNQPAVDAGFDKKTKLVLYCNPNTGEDYILDRMVRTYNCKKCLAALLYNMIYVSAVNVFIVWLIVIGESLKISIEKQRY